MEKMVIYLGENHSIVAETGLRPLKGVIKPDTTHVFPGGTRCIGLNLGNRMIDQGACCIVVLGRTGASDSDTKKTVNKYKDANVCFKVFAPSVGFRN